MSSNLLGSAVHPADGWPALVPLDAPDLPRLDLRHLPGWAGNFAQALAAATETPPELAAGMVLAACATAVARRMAVEIKPGYVEPSNLWLLVALPSGSRKSAVQSAAAAPLLLWEREQAANLAPEIHRITSERKTMEARATEIRKKAARVEDADKAIELAQEAASIEDELPHIPIEPQLWTSDSTPERLGSLLAAQGECLGWLSSEGGIFDMLQGRYSNAIPNLDLVLKAHSADAERVDRGSRPPVFLQYPRLSIGLSPQPDVLRGLAFKPGFRGRGLLARFLYLLPPSLLGYRRLESTPMPENVSDAYAKGLHAMLDQEPDPEQDSGEKRLLTVKLSPTAFSEWLAFAKGIERQMRPGENLEHCTDWAGKAPGAAARVAAVLHAIKHAHGAPHEALITDDTMNDALVIMAVVTHHSIAALNLMGTNPTVAAAQRVWAWIERNKRPHFTERDAFNPLRGTFPQVKDLRPALEALAERGYVAIIEPESQGRGRPRSPMVYVRPDIAENWR